MSRITGDKAIHQQLRSGWNQKRPLRRKLERNTIAVL